MGSYWHAVLSKAFWDSFKLFYESPNLLFVGILGAAVTAFLVLALRGKQAFVEHIKANVLIAMVGGVITWILVFPYFLIRAPFDLSSDVQFALQRSQERERSAVMSERSATVQLNAERKEKSTRASNCPQSHAHRPEGGKIKNANASQNQPEWTTVRAEISRRAKLGNDILEECRTLQEKPELEAKTEAWFNDTYNYLLSIDPGFASTFRNHSGVSFTTSIKVGNEPKPIPQLNQNVLTFMTYKEQALEGILQQIPLR